MRTLLKKSTPFSVAAAVLFGLFSFFFTAAFSRAEDEKPDKKKPAATAANSEADSSDSKPNDPKAAKAKGKKDEKKEETAEEKAERLKKEAAEKEKKDQKEAYSRMRKDRDEKKTTFWFSYSFTTWFSKLPGGIAGIKPVLARDILGQEVPIHFWSPNGFDDTWPQIHTGQFTNVAGTYGGAVVLYDSTSVGPECCVYADAADEPIAVFRPWNNDSKTWGDPSYVNVRTAGGEVIKEGNPLRAWKFQTKSQGMLLIYPKHDW